MKVVSLRKLIRMKWISTFFAYVAVAIIAGPVAADEVSTTAAITAVQQRICYEAFWWDRDNFDFGTTLTMTLRNDGDMAYAWVDNLAHVRGASEWASFFTIFTKDNMTAVAASYGYNLDVMRGKPDFEQKRSK